MGGKTAAGPDNRQSAYASRLARAIRENRRAELYRLLRVRVASAYLRAIRLEGAGFTLEFKYPVSRFAYLNETFREGNP